jgi:DnaJ domain
VIAGQRQRACVGVIPDCRAAQRRAHADLLRRSRRRQGADADTIKNAYRQRAKACHPDLNPGHRNAARQFVDVAAAYDLLSDPRRRAIYDYELKMAVACRREARGRLVKLWAARCVTVAGAAVSVVVTSYWLGVAVRMARDDIPVRPADAQAAFVDRRRSDRVPRRVRERRSRCWLDGAVSSCPGDYPGHGRCDGVRAICSWPAATWAASWSTFWRTAARSADIALSSCWAVNRLETWWAAPTQHHRVVEASGL